MRQSLLFSLVPVLVAAGPGINPNPNTNFDPSTSKGTFGPFVAAQKAAPGATGGPTGAIDARTKQAMQLAISNWQTDTGIVSGFQNIGGVTKDTAQFMGIADGAFKAEVDELSQKAVLDQVIGNDPRVSIANLTLTNGVFQSVVDNLQIMSLQGQSRVNLIDAINQVRCVQILPSIDTYMIVAAEYIGDNVQQRRAVRPAACAGILAANVGNSTAFPNVPGTPNGNPRGRGDGIVLGVPNACSTGAGVLPPGQTPTSNGTTGGRKGSGNTNNGNNANKGSAPVLPPLSNTTTPQLGLPGFAGSTSGTGNGNAANTTSSAIVPSGTGNSGRKSPQSGLNGGQGASAGTGQTPQGSKTSQAPKVPKSSQAAQASSAPQASPKAGSGQRKGSRIFPLGPIKARNI